MPTPYKMILVIQNESGEEIETFSPRSYHDFETLIEKAYAKHLILKDEWLEQLTLTIKTFETPIILPEAAFEAPVEEAAGEEEYCDELSLGEDEELNSEEQETW